MKAKRVRHRYRQVTRDQARTLHALGFKVYYKGSYGYHELLLLCREWDLPLFVRVE